MKYVLTNVQVTSVVAPDFGKHGTDTLLAAADARSSVKRHRLRTYGVSEMGIAQLFEGQLITDPNDRRIIRAIVLGAR